MQNLTERFALLPGGKTNDVTEPFPEKKTTNGDPTLKGWLAKFCCFPRSTEFTIFSFFSLQRTVCPRVSSVLLFSSVRLVCARRCLFVHSEFDNCPVTVKARTDFAKSHYSITAYLFGCLIIPIPSFVFPIMLFGWNPGILGEVKWIFKVTRATEWNNRTIWYSFLSLVCSAANNVYCIVSYVQRFNCE